MFIAKSRGQELSDSHQVLALWWKSADEISFIDDHHKLVARCNLLEFRFYPAAPKHTHTVSAHGHFGQDNFHLQMQVLSPEHCNQEEKGTTSW